MAMVGQPNYGFLSMSDNLRGAMLMMISMASFTFNDACMKGVAAHLPFFQALFLRGVGTTILLLVLARALGMLRFLMPRRDMGIILIRTGAEIGAAYFFITAIFHAPIANITAIIQAIPLSVTLAGALFLGEAVGWRRLSAIIVGFLGVLLIVRPGTSGFDFYSVYALITVVFVTIRDLSTRRLSKEVPSVMVAVTSAAGVTLFAGIGVAGDEWVPLTFDAAWRLGGAMVFVIGGYLASVMVMRIGEIGFVAPFRYTSLLWAIVLGIVFFNEWPDHLTLTGSAVVVATGIYTLYRERRLRRKAAVAPLRPR